MGKSNDWIILLIWFLISALAVALGMLGIVDWGVVKLVVGVPLVLYIALWAIEKIFYKFFFGGDKNDKGI